MINALWELILLFFFAFMVLLPVYIKLLEEGLYKKWEERLKQQNMILVYERRKKVNDRRK